MDMQVGELVCFIIQVISDEGFMEFKGHRLQ